MHWYKAYRAERHNYTPEKEYPLWDLHPHWHSNIIIRTLDGKKSWESGLHDAVASSRWTGVKGTMSDSYH